MTWTVTTVVVTGVLFVLFERLIPFRKGQSIFRKGAL